MKPCKKSPFTILLVEILICKYLFMSKTSKHTSNTYQKLSMISSPNLLRSRKLWSLKVELGWLLMKYREKYYLVLFY